jgi:hypothetical protein
MTTFRPNRTQGRSFKPSVLCFAFCMAQAVAFVMQVAWAAELNVAIVSNVLVAACVILLVHVICMK